MSNERSKSSTGARAATMNLHLSIASFIAMLALWIGLTGSGLWAPIVDPMFLPSPLGVAQTFWKLCMTGYQGNTLLHHFLISLARFGVAFAFCIVVGVPVGLLMGMHGGVRAVLDPPIEITRPIPKLALLPLFIIWFGIGELSKAIVIIAALFPMMTISAMQAVRSVSLRKIQAAQSLGATPAVIFRRVLLPASLPGIFTGIRVSIGIGVTMLVGAEMVATNDGIAWMALTAADFMLTDVVLVGVLIMALLGYSLDRLFRLLEAKLVHWSGKD
ncbi:ABC transporter permease subunit [Parapusillimonas granuli]|uniref:ABC transporter permease n=1 Tax=Parapusillimonas granuli TaxID=380911 RepID=A0A853FWD4_9BURK|nr:ABC-type nitrate/sulfonate/bicarbonate transport system permease component [Parapusillimonas granuli]MEB2398281.1 ABC transporter permease [Alcaligenaceae bacterium]NYT49118.1 ABC transporter permease [Parapusillimonas granuli]